MNENFTNNIQPEDTELANKLNRVSEQTRVDPHFMSELEQKLKAAHKPKITWWAPSNNSSMPSPGWVALVVVVGLLLIWSIQNLIPAVQPAANVTPTPPTFNNTPAYTSTPQANATPALKSGEYAWRSTKLNLSQPLPQAPTAANVYLLNLKQPATMDDILVLAQKFEIQGEAQEVQSDSVGNPGYVITDGIQRLEMQASHHFVFYTNYPAPASGTVPDAQARIAIDNFLKKYGFDFEYRLESASELTPQQYVILPLTPDGAEIRSDYLMSIRYEVVIDGTGQILAFSGFPLDYETVGTFQLITAEEAFQSVLNDNPQFGRMESVRGNGGGGGGGPGFYKLNLSGTPMPFQTAIIQPDITRAGFEYTVLENDTLASIAATFGVSLEQLAQANNLSNDNFIFIGQKLIIPGPQPQEPSPYIGKRLEDQRGIVVVNIYRKPDSSQHTEYIFITTQDGQGLNVALEGDGLQELEKYHNLPLNIWATIESMDEFGMLTAHVDRFVVPFPDLQIEIFQGKQQATQIDGLPAVLFTTADGTTYIQAIINGDPFVNNSILGVEGDEILLEAIHIPDDFHSGYPVLRTFSASMVDPNNNETTEMLVTANQPYIMDDIPIDEGFIPPTATIEKVELVYYLPNLQSGNPNPDADAKYLQPAWRFYGHYSTGDEFEFLIQALKQEFLLPELAPYTPPG